MRDNGQRTMPRATWRGIGAAIMALSLSGCISTSYRDSVGRFGVLTKAAVAAQNERLDALAAAETERVHADLAQRRVDLRWTKECNALLKPPSLPPPVPPTPPATAKALPCRLIEVRADPHAPAKAVEEISYDNIRALGAALSDYSDNLILLAADSTEDRKAFATSVSGLATSLGGLDGALRKATGAQPAKSSDTLNGIGALVGKVGGMVLAAERARALKRIVESADPLVQDAVAILVDVDNQLGVYDMANRAEALRKASVAATDLVHSPPAAGETEEQFTARIRAAQDDLFAKFALYRAGAAEQQHYAAIGIAHAKLAAAAKEGATAADLQAAIEAVLDLASATSDLIKKPAPAAPGDAS